MIEQEWRQLFRQLNAEHWYDYTTTPHQGESMSFNKDSVKVTTVQEHPDIHIKMPWDVAVTLKEVLLSIHGDGIGMDHIEAINSGLQKAGVYMAPKERFSGELEAV